MNKQHSFVRERIEQSEAAMEQKGAIKISRRRRQNTA